MLLSVVDQAPARADGAPGHAVRETLDLCRAAERLGFHRFWVAEHHAIGSVTSSAPEVIIGMLGAATRRIRVGSGGMLLPNHRPIHVAEQFQMLEALLPGRVDLGVGRSEGAIDPAMVQALARPEDNAHGEGFERQLDELLAFGGVRPLPAGHPLAGVRAAPAGVPLPPVTLLGSSPGSARTAARKGLAYGFATYSDPDAAAPALRAYRKTFVPGRPGDRPHAILAVKVMTGEDDAHAAALSAPGQLSLVQARLGRPAGLVPMAEALAHRWTAEEREAEARHADTRADVVGGPATVRARLEAMAAEAGADEVIVVVNTYGVDERIASLARLAGAFALAQAA